MKLVFLFLLSHKESSNHFPRYLTGFCTIGSIVSPCTFSVILSVIHPFFIIRHRYFFGLNSIFVHGTVSLRAPRTSCLNMCCCCYIQVIYKPSVGGYIDYRPHPWSSGFSFSCLDDYVHPHHKQDRRDDTACYNPSLQVLSLCFDVLKGEPQLDVFEIAVVDIYLMSWNMVWDMAVSICLPDLTIRTYPFYSLAPLINLLITFVCSTHQEKPGILPFWMDVSTLSLLYKVM